MRKLSTRRSDDPRAAPHALPRRAAVRRGPCAAARAPACAPRPDSASAGGAAPGRCGPRLRAQAGRGPRDKHKHKRGRSLSLSPIAPAPGLRLPTTAPQGSTPGGPRGGCCAVHLAQHAVQCPSHYLGRRGTWSWRARARAKAALELEGRRSTARTARHADRIAGRDRIGGPGPLPPSIHA